MSKAEKTREFIIEKAAPVFNMKGYAGTSMSDLTEATGLTKGAIYGNFENKDAVALAVYDYNYGLTNSAAEAAVSQHTSCIGKLHAMAEFYTDYFKTVVTRGGCPVLNTAVEADDSHPELKARAASSIRNWIAVIERIIEKGIRNGEIKPDANASEFAIAFVAMIEGGIMMSKVTSDRKMLDTCAQVTKEWIDTKLRI